jgi:hypothetical protein
MVSLLSTDLNCRDNGDKGILSIILGIRSLQIVLRKRLEGIIEEFCPPHRINVDIHTTRNFKPVLRYSHIMNRWTRLVSETYFDARFSWRHYACIISQAV